MHDYFIANVENLKLFESSMISKEEAKGGQVLSSIDDVLA